MRMIKSFGRRRSGLTGVISGQMPVETDKRHEDLMTANISVEIKNGYLLNTRPLQMF
jgi:hypothetical protein